MNDAQKIAALEAQLAEGIEAIKSREAQKDSALTHVRTEAKAALSEAQARSTKLEKRLKELEDMKLPELDDNRELDMSNPEDVKLLKILKHFGGAEILKVVQETEELQKKLSNLKQQIQSREKELKRMKDMAAEAKATVNTDVVPLEKLLVEKEEELRQKVVDEGQGDVLRHFLQRQHGLLEQEQALRGEVEAKENELASIRVRFQN